MRRVAIAFYLFVLVVTGSSAFSIFDPMWRFFTHDPEETMTGEEVIKYHGYPVKEIDVTTDDGYVLTLQRIPHGKTNGNATGPRKPILVQHGILANSACWYTNPPDKNLPYLLADAGYDVWLGNFRGTNYGKKHVSLSTKSEQFWQFSFNEMAKYDLPAIIDYILETTGFEQLDYAAHSMGVTTALVMLSTRTEYNAKLKSLHGLAPVARLDHQNSPLLKMVVPFSNILSFTRFIGSYEYPPPTPFIDLLGQTLCKLPTKKLCSNAIYWISGFDSKQFNETRLPVYLHFLPAGTSAQTLHHFAQIIRFHKFRAYNYGSSHKNIDHYGQSEPPDYDITKVSTPVYLYWSDNDYLADPKDVPFIEENVQNLKESYRVPFSSFSHVDFLWAKDILPLLYDKVMSNILSS